MTDLSCFAAFLGFGTICHGSLWSKAKTEVIYFFFLKYITIGNNQAKYGLNLSCRCSENGS